MTPKNSTKELLQLINNFRKMNGYRINSNKSVTFLYSQDKWGEKEIRHWEVVMHTFNPSTREAEEVTSLDSRPAWSTE